MNKYSPRRHYYNPIYLQYFISKKRIYLLSDLLQNLYSYLPRDSYKPVKNFIEEMDLFKNLSRKEVCKPLNDLRRLGIISLYDKHLKIKPFYDNVSIKSDYVSFNYIYEASETMDPRKAILLYAFNKNIIVSRYLATLTNYIELSIDTGLEILLNVARKILSNFMPDYRLSKVIDQINNRELYINKFLNPFKHLTDSAISYIRRRNIIIIKGDIIKTYIKTKPIIIENIYYYVRDAYIKALEELNMYDDWRKGGLIYISLLRVYNKLIQNYEQARLLVPTYDNFIELIKRLSYISDNIKLSIHPRYIDDKDRGYRLYIVP